MYSRTFWDFVYLRIGAYNDRGRVTAPVDLLRAVLVDPEPNLSLRATAVAAKRNVQCFIIMSLKIRESTAAAYQTEIPHRLCTHYTHAHKHARY